MYMFTHNPAPCNLENKINAIQMFTILFAVFFHTFFIYVCIYIYIHISFYVSINLL